MKYKVMAVVISAILGSLVSVTPVRAETKQVAIELTTETDGKENYLPGEKAEYKAVIRNLLGPAWIRVRFDLSEQGINADFTEENLLVQDGWVKKGDYYYYTQKAETGKEYMAVDGLMIPDATIAGEGAGVNVRVFGDAVQYDSVEPDFSDEIPWKNKKPNHSVSATVISSGEGDSSLIRVYPSPRDDGVMSRGQWELMDSEKHIWKYRDRNGSYAKNGWIYAYNPYSSDEGRYDWFHFDEEGMMTFGWYKASETVWYYTWEVSDGNLGMLIKGWHNDVQDGKWYYLDPSTGIMLSGWQEIDGKKYYFTSLQDVPGQTWFWNTGLGKWLYELLGYQSYGSLYEDGKFLSSRQR